MTAVFFLQIFPYTLSVLYVQFRDLLFCLLDKNFLYNYLSNAEGTIWCLIFSVFSSLPLLQSSSSSSLLSEKSCIDSDHLPVHFLPPPMAKIKEKCNRCNKCFWYCGLFFVWLGYLLIVLLSAREIN